MASASPTSWVWATIHGQPLRNPQTLWRLPQQRAPSAAARSLAEPRVPAFKPRGPRLHDASSFGGANNDGCRRRDCCFGWCQPDPGISVAGNPGVPRTCAKRGMPGREWYSHLYDFGNAQRKCVGYQRHHRAASVSGYDTRLRHFTENMDSHQSCGCDKSRTCGRIAWTVLDLRRRHRSDAERDAHNSRCARPCSLRCFIEESDERASARPRGDEPSTQEIVTMRAGTLISGLALCTVFAA